MIALLLALVITFPRTGASLPAVDRCYMTGAVPRGVTNLVVQGKGVRVYRTGAWCTMLEVVPGTNTVEVVAGEVASNLVFRVAAKPQPPKSASTNRPPEKVWEKLPCAGDAPRPHPSGRAASDIVIALDPGHGGNDTGALSPHGYHEKEANLLVAFEVRRALTNLGYRVVMTREDDRAIVLTERPCVAHANDADAFVSIHHNAPPLTRDPLSLRYTAVYSWNPLGERLAKAIDSRLGKALAGDIPDNGTMHANFAVTRNPEIPSCLVEVDFLTSPAGEEAVWDHRRRRRIGIAIAQGIDDWVKSDSAAAERQ